VVEAFEWEGLGRGAAEHGRAAHATVGPMHYDAHQPIIAELEARILTIRDSL
jgi:hypothetical protein